jgi:hypothetical protein
MPACAITASFGFDNYNTQAALMLRDLIDNYLDKRAVHCSWNEDVMNNIDGVMDVSQEELAGQAEEGSRILMEDDPLVLPPPSATYLLEIKIGGRVRRIFL